MEQVRSRAYNSILNSIWGIAASAITVILNFAVRFFLVRELGEEINGLNSLFQSIITMMALMEMGIGSAMIIHLYEPLKNKNYSLASGILIFYRKVYSWLALAFFIIGIIVSVFLLDLLVESNIPSNEVRIYFIIFASSIAFDYLTYYKRSILFADQKNRISAGSTALCEVVFRTLQIALMILYKSYYLFLAILIVEKVVSNYLCSYYVNKHYPQIDVKRNKEIGIEQKKAIFNTIKPLMVNQTATSIQNSSTSILIGLLLGNVSIVGFYGSYALLVGVIQQIYSQFGGAFTTSFGNLAVDNDKQRMSHAFFKTAFLLNWFSCFCCAVFIACSSDFLYVFFGEHFVLPSITVWIMTINLIIYLISIPAVSVQNAMGTHRLDAKYMVIQALLVIAIGYLLGSVWGMNGILIGMTIPTFFLLMINKGVKVTMYAVGLKAKRYIIFVFIEFIKIFVCVFVAFYVCKFVNIDASILSVIVKGAIAGTLSLILYLSFSFKTDSFYELKALLIGRLKK